MDPVELDILSGLTGIVGPNGCGKSNLLEALRWVMGENRPSSVRSGSMDDVIFAGAGTRTAKNFAEVLLGLTDVGKSPEIFHTQDGCLEIVRRVTRDVGSSYRLNGKDVRAKDISMLFADSSTGAHSPSLVRQGQITELINANPKSRRRLLEEAAGISGLYQRRHEAELKLKASEANMGRLLDVIEQVDSQIKTLAKQAKQATKYEMLANSIRKNEALLFCKKWFDLDIKFHHESDALTEKTKLSAEAQLELITFSGKREQIEAQLPDLRNEEISASSALQRIIVEKENTQKEERRAADNILELNLRVEETSKDHVRQNNLISDAEEVVKRIKWESEQLKKLSEGQDELIKKAQREASEASEKLNRDELKLDNDSEDLARLSARFQNIEKQIQKTKADLEKTLADLNHCDEQEVNLVISLEQKQKEQTKAKTYFQACKEDSKMAEKLLLSAEKLRGIAGDAELEKRIDFSSSEGKLAALESEKDTLTSLLSPAVEKSNQILDQIRVVEGYEIALGAAFSDDIKAPIIFSNDKSGWFKLPELRERPEFPEGVVPISDKVKAPVEMTRRLGFIGLVDSINGPRFQKFLKPGQKLVSKEGAIWRWDGYCCLEVENLSEATTRLKQDNRLSELLTLIEKTEKEVELLRMDLEKAEDKSSDLKKAGLTARNARVDSDEKLSEASRLLSAADSDLSILISKLQSVKDNQLTKETEKERLESEIIELTKIFNSFGDISSNRHLLEKQRSAVELSRKLMVEKRTMFDRVKRDADMRAKRLVELDIDLENWNQRLKLASESIIELKKRLTTVGEELRKAKMQPKILADRAEDLAKLLNISEKKKVEAIDNLSVKESELRLSVKKEKEVVRKVSGLREEVVRITTLKENAELNLKELRKVIKEQTFKEPEDLIENLNSNLDQLPDTYQIEADLSSLKSKRDALGAVNLRAAEDSEKLNEEWETLTAEQIELETAIKKLRSAIITLNSEGRVRLLAAFKEVNNNFGELFKNLFGGGNAKLTFIESEDPLEAGLEIICQPPGKKLSTLSLLSGGEQTLTALALIFAVFRANPSPICVLDEVDAPLDDANVQRFCGLLDEMIKTTNTRFMIITHHPLTMSRMDRLYGVTMVERGVSQLVSVDLKKAEQMLES